MKHPFKVRNEELYYRPNLKEQIIHDSSGVELFHYVIKAEQKEKRHLYTQCPLPLTDSCHRRHL